MPKSFHTSNTTAEKMRQRKLNRKQELLRERIIEGVADTKNLSKEERLNQIAYFNEAETKSFIQNIYSSDSFSIFHGYKERASSQFMSDREPTTKLLTALDKKGFFDELRRYMGLDNTTKVETGTQLMHSNINRSKVYMYQYSTQKQSSDFHRMSEAYRQIEEIKKNGGVIFDYDIESNGGVNAFGHQQIDAITEVSAKGYLFDGKGGYREIENMTTLLGYSEAEYLKTKKYLEGLSGKVPGQLTVKDKVYLNRFSRIGDPNIGIDFSDGFNVTVGNTDKALSDKDLKVTVEKALEGLEVQRKIGIHQEKWIKGQNLNMSLEDYKRQYLINVQEMVMNGKGQNGVYKNAVVMGHNIINFDNDQLSRITGHNISNPSNYIFDSYQFLIHSNSVLGQGSHYKGVDLTRLVAKTKEHGTGTQDFLRALFGLGKGQSHNAGFDVDSHFDLIMNPDSEFGKFISKSIGKMNARMSDLKGGYIQNRRQGIFYNASTLNEGWNNKDNALSFVYDPLNDTFKSFSGYSVDAKGNVTQGDFGAWGPKANALYEKTIHEVSLGEDWRKVFAQMGIDNSSMDSFYQQYGSRDKVWIVQSKEYIDEARLKARYGENASVHNFNGGKQYFEIITDEQKLATNLGLKVGYKNADGSFSPIMNHIDALGLQTQELIDGKVVVEKLEGQDAVNAMLDRHVFRTTADGSARTIRDASYSRFQMQRNFAIANGKNLSAVLAESIAKNKDLTLDLTAGLIEEFGWTDFKDIKADGSFGKKIVPERLGKAVAIDDYVSQGEDIFNIMEELFEKSGLGEHYKSYETKNGFKVFDKDSAHLDNYNKRDFLFKETLNRAMEDISSNPSAISGSAPALMTRFEANRIDFDKFEIFPELSNVKLYGNVANSSSNIISLNLDSPNALIKMFSNGKFENMDIIPSSNAAYEALLFAYDIIGSDSRFEGVWNGLSKKDLDGYRKGNLTILNDEMQSRLRSFVYNKRNGKDGDLSFGFKYARTVQDPKKQWELLNSLSLEDKKTVLTKAYDSINLNNYVSLKTASKSNDMINSIVDNYFMTFSEAELKNQIADLTPRQQNIMMSNYKLARRDAAARAQELVNAAYAGNANLIMSGKGIDARLLLQNGGDIRDLEMYKYTLTNGIIETNIGGNYYAVNHAYNVSDMVKNGVKRSDDKLRIKVTNNIQNTIDHMATLEKTVERAKDGGRNILDDLTYQIKRRNKLIREASPRREAFNYTNTLERAIKVDYNGLISILPELEKAGVIDKIINTTNMNPKYAKDFKNYIKEMADGKYRPRFLDEMFSNPKSMYFQLFDATITDFITPDFFDDETAKAFESISSYGKNTNYVHGEKSLDSAVPHGAGRFDMNTRPPIYQFGNTEMYDKKKIQKAIDKGIKDKHSIFDHVFNKSNITTSAATKYMYNAATSIDGVTLTSGLTLKYLQAGSTELRKGILNLSRGDEGKKARDFLTKAFGKDSNALSVIEDRIKSMTTYEQQTQMNSRVFDIAYNKTNKQIISKKKQLLLDHEENLEVIEHIKKNISDLYPVVRNGRIEYVSGIEVKTNQLLGVFGDPSSPERIRAKFDGLFRTRYYDNGNVVSQETLNKYIKDMGLGSASDQEIIDALDKKFDRRLEVARKYQTYGQKIFNDSSEKSTVETLAMNIGSLDNELAKKLKELNKSELIGNVLSADYEEHFLAKYGSIDVKGISLAERYLTEKHALSDFLTNIKGLEDVSQFIALDVLKHKSTSMALTNGLKQLEEAGMLNEKNLDALLGKGNYTLKGGVVNFDNVTEINLKALKNFNKKAYEVFTKIDESLGFGHKGYSHVVQVRDDSAGTYAGRFTKAALENGEADSFKGVKFSKTMNNTLRAAKYEDDAMGLAHQRYLELGLGDEFLDVFGDVLDDEGKVIATMKGQGILDPVVDRLQGALSITEGQQLLKDADPNRYGYLLKEFGDNADKITVDRAVLANAYGQGKIALNFNSNYTGEKKTFSKSEYKRLTKELPEHLRFTEVDLTKARPGVAEDWLSLDVGGQGNTVTSAVNNPYTQNLMIKYGPNEKDILAIARMPEKHFDDSLIKQQHISKLNHLQNTIQELNSGSFASESEKVRLQETIGNIAEEIKSLQKKDITSKNGIAGQLTSTRMDQSFIGKGSGISISDTDISSLRDVVNVKDMQARKAKLIADNNSKFSKAMFGGKSIIEHYAEGKAINHVFLSKDAFKNMGYFDKDFMERIFTNMDDAFGDGMKKSYLDASTLADKEAVMEKLLSIYGDSFIGTRYPEIMEGSDVMLMGYLNSDLKGNQIQYQAYTGAGMRLDHDGDQAAVMRAKTKTRMVNGNMVEGESMLEYVTNRAGASQELIKHATAIERSLMLRATNENWYWDDQARNRLKKEGIDIAQIMKNVTDKEADFVNQIGADRFIDGSLVSSQIDFSQMKAKDFEPILNEYGDLLKLGDHKEAVAQIDASGGKYNIDDYKKAFVYQSYRDELVAKASNQAIGEVNATNAKIKAALSGLIETTSDEYKYNQITSFDLFHISEEAAISAKSSIEGLDPDRAKKWNDMAMQLITGQGDANELKAGMKAWANEYTIKDMKFEQYWDASSVFQEKARAVFKDETLDFNGFKTLMKNSENRVLMGQRVIDDFVETLGEMGKVDNIQKVFDQFSVGQSTGGVVKGIDTLTTFDGFSNNYDGMVEMLKMQENIAKEFDFITIQDKISRRSYAQGNIAEEFLSSMDREKATKSISHAVLEGATDVFKGIGSSGIALGAIGIAAGIMMAGYVGGRPRPADVHAMEEAQDFQAPMEGHSVLADPGLSFQQGNGMNGYVVNINARTDKSREHAISAIQQAINQGTSSSINVSMNINDNYGNITDRDLERAMTDVLR